MGAITVKKDIQWVGTLDPELRIFDIIMRAEHGTTYNSYLIFGKDKLALIDTSKDKFAQQYVQNLADIVDLRKIDYIVAQHLEPDHSGALSLLLESASNAQVVVSKAGELFVKNIVNRPIPILKVEDRAVIDLGGKQLQFIMAPFLHWPDTMFTYVPEDKILFTCDFLGCHFCDERMFNDLVDDFSYAFRYYFDVIIRPFKEYAQKALAKIKPLSTEVVAPSHGPVLRKDPQKYIRLYDEWSQPRKDELKKVVIAYASSYGNTAKLAKEIARAFEDAGIKVSLFDLVGVQIERMIDPIEAAEVLIVGSATINSDAVKPVWDLLSSLATLKLKGKLGAAFGSYGWSGEGPRLIASRLKGLKFRVPFEPFLVQMVPTEADLKKAYDYGQRLAQYLNQ